MALLLGLCLGCVSQGAHLSRQQAVAIAKRVAVEQHEQLHKYRTPDASFYRATRRWQVGFRQKEPYTYGKPETYHYFAVTIDDKTGAATYEPGKFK